MREANFGRQTTASPIVVTGPAPAGLFFCPLDFMALTISVNKVFLPRWINELIMTRMKILLGGVSLTTPLLMNDEQIVRAAEELIAKHKDSALAQADKQISTCESEGYGSVAETWKLIREVIRDIQQSGPSTKRYRMAPKKGVLLSA